jgi:fatty acid desaturase
LGSAIDGREALRRRDLFETFAVKAAPPALRKWLSAMVTAICGVAPRASGGRPPWEGSELRALLYMLASLLAGSLAIFAGVLAEKVLGGLLLVSAMRNFSSSVGHQLTHSTRGLPWSGKWTRLGYDLLGALLLLPTYDDYRIPHGQHHAKVAGDGDPDQDFINYLQACFAGPHAFFTTLISPALHVRFAQARIRAALNRGPIWRRFLAIAGIAAGCFLPWGFLAVWAFFLMIGYQMASLTSFVSLHLWGNRPASKSPKEVATAVTFGRLLIPEPTVAGVLLLPLYAVVRALWLQGDLNNHDLHHLGKGPWTEAAYHGDSKAICSVTWDVRVYWRLPAERGSGRGDVAQAGRMRRFESLAMEDISGDLSRIYLLRESISCAPKLLLRSVL